MAIKVVLPEKYGDAMAGGISMKTVLLKPGAVGEDVYAVNYILKKLEYRISKITDLYKSETKVAVESLQNDLGLDVTGIVDTKTFTLLKKLFETRFPEEAVLGTDDEKAEAIAVSSPEILEGAPEAGISQASHEAEIEGPIEYVSLNDEQPDDIVSIYEGYEKQGSSESPYFKNIQICEEAGPQNNFPQSMDGELEALSSPLLNEGARGLYVRILQNSLKEAGYYDGNVDSIYGPGTKRAVKEFQGSVGLVPDGCANEETWSALEGGFRSDKSRKIEIAYEPKKIDKPIA
ncbi:MAG: peptidoglycan-binding protein, partial [Clostridiales bacterium]|nr:peptidoglycan-binding protein [Clostridiales bacterium]